MTFGSSSTTISTTGHMAPRNSTAEEAHSSSNSSRAGCLLGCHMPRASAAQQARRTCCWTCQQQHPGRCAVTCADMGTVVVLKLLESMVMLVEHVDTQCTSTPAGSSSGSSNSAHTRSTPSPQNPSPPPPPPHCAETDEAVWRSLILLFEHVDTPSAAVVA